MKYSKIEHIGDTVHLQRMPRLRIIEGANRLYLENVETGEFEAVSTQFLDSMLEFGEGSVRFTVRNMRRLHHRRGTGALRAPWRLRLVAQDGQLVGSLED